LTPSVRDVGIGLLAAVFVASPALFTSWGFGPDFTNHIWLVNQQAVAIGRTGHPTLFLEVDGVLRGVFEPFYGFYGGTLYAIAGAVSAILGQRPFATYVGSIVVFAAMAYRGVWLLGRQIGLTRLLAHVPAFVFTASAYFLTDLYARGAWPELAALAALPFAVAYGVRLLRGDWTAGAILGFAWGVVILSGSHNISLFWSALLIAIVAVAAWSVLGSDRPRPIAIARTVVIGGLAVGVNFWFLLLDLRHSNDTLISHTTIPWEFTKQFDTPKAILNPFRTAPESGTFQLVVTAPVLAVVIGIVLMVIYRRAVPAAPRAVKRLWLICVGLIALLLVLMMMPGPWWRALGSPFTLIQFPYRLSGWLTFAMAVLLALSLRLAGGARRPGRATVALTALLVAVTAAQAAYQMYHIGGNPPSKRNRAMALEKGTVYPPSTWYDPGSYRDSSRRLLTLNIDYGRIVELPLPRPGDTTVSRTVTLPDDFEPVLSNIAGGPYVVRVSGVGVPGRYLDGRAALLRLPGSPRRVTVTVTADGGKPQLLAGIISVVSIVALLAIAAAVAIMGRRRRGDRSPRTGDAAPDPDGDLTGAGAGAV
jgi:hypothetical protein